MNFSTLCTILVAFGPETPEVTTLTIAPFAAIRQKSAYHAKYLRISYTYLDLLYRFVRHISRDDFPSRLFVWQSCKGCCYGNQLNMGDVRKLRVECPLLFALAFDNRLGDRKSAFNRFDGNNQCTSLPNLVNLRPTILEFSLLNAQFLPRFARNLTTIFIRHVGAWKRIWGSQFWFQRSNHHLFLYIL